MLPQALVALSLFLSAVQPASALWPQPRQITTGQTALKLSPGFDIKLTGIHNAPKDLTDAVSRTSSFLRKDKLEALVVDRGASSAKVVKAAKSLKALRVSLTGDSKTVKSISEEATLPLESRSESYTLTIPADGSDATLQANSTLGLFRGLTTFEQIWYELDGNTYTLQAPFDIVDSPAYPYRGLMLDTARNFFPVEDIKRTLDAMSWAKINTFHWHVVDSQSFPLQIPGFMELSQTAAYNSRAVYSPADVKDVVSYAAARGIDVIAEIDTPGHTAAIAKSHPEHIACPEASPWTQFANEPPAGQLRLANEQTTRFTSSLLTSAASLFKSHYFGTGGDEINLNCYAKDEQTQAELTAQNKTIDSALDAFTQASHKALKAVGKTPVVWEGKQTSLKIPHKYSSTSTEMLLVHPVTLDPETLVLVWISADNVKSVVDKGFKVIHAANDYFYLDCGGGGWVGQNVLGNSWCDPFKTWQKAYSFDPLANLTPDQHHLVQGGQHLLWTEQSSPSNLDSTVWPRAATSAEVFWSGPGGDVGAALPRLHDLAYRYKQRGVCAISLQPEWCALRPGKCDLNA